MSPPTKLTLSDWADRFRFLSPEASSEPGRWKTSKAEYQRGMMDTISDPKVEETIIMSSAQVGKTELLNNVAGFHIHQDPAPILVIMPTVGLGEDWSKDRLTPMLRDSPALNKIIPDAKSRDGKNTITHKSFPGGHLTVAGANAPSSLAARPIRVLMMDEVDRYPTSVGEEGDPVNLGRKRTNNFWNRRVLMVSTPTIRGRSRIEKAFLSGDQRYFHVPCPHCDFMQQLVWSQVIFSGDDESTAAYHCIECSAAWSDAQRWAALADGKWVATKPFAGKASFHLNELYSPWRKVGQVVREFLDAKDDPNLLKTWVNTALGETWQEKGEVPEWERLGVRAEELVPGVMPPQALILTAAVDVQRNRLEMTVFAWAESYECWPVDHYVFFGDPADNEPWDEVALVMDRTYDEHGLYRIAKACVDTGDNTNAVYLQLRRLNHPNLEGIKGSNSWDALSPVTGPAYVDVKQINGRKVTRGFKLYHVASSHYKQDTYRRLNLKLTEDLKYPPGWFHVPSWMSAEQLQQLTAEHLVTHETKKGYARSEWHKLRDRNELLDTAVYARAALTLLGSEKYGDRFWKALRASKVVVDDKPIPVDNTAEFVQPPPPVVRAPVLRRAAKSSYMTRLGR